MVREYKKKYNTGRLNYTQDNMASALVDVGEGMTERAAAAKWKVPKSTLHHRVCGHIQSPGRSGNHTALLAGEERALAENMATLGDFGLAFDQEELRSFVKDHLDKMQRSIPQFKNNRPGIDWVYGFMKRHSDLLSNRHCQNISRKRAAVSETIVSAYFANLEASISGIDPEFIINYDETNLTDDPKTKLMIFRKGSKHPERIMNTTKSSTSIMFALTATGVLLDPYVVFKGERLQDTWMMGGPLHTHYNVSKSGWFDSDTFVDWFKKVVVRFAERNAQGKEVALIGDNLASHMSLEVVTLCEKYKIRLIFLPPNSTHLLQPLDVGVFGPLKCAWKHVLTEWKETDGKHATTLPKWTLPRLLLQLLHAMEPRWPQLAVSAFRTCGIYPLDPEAVLLKLRREDPALFKNREAVSPNLLAFLTDKRDTSVRHQKPRSKRINVAPGTSMTLADLGAASTSGTSTARPAQPPTKKRKVRQEEEDEEDETDQEEEEAPEEEAPEQESEEMLLVPANLKPAGYVLVRFGSVNKQPHHFVAKLINKTKDGWIVNYWRKTEPMKHHVNLVNFVEPQRSDEGLATNDMIVMHLVLKEVYKNRIMFKNNFKNMIIR